MVTPEVIQYLMSIESPKVREYCATYTQIIQQKFGRMFDISLLSFENDEDLRYVSLSYYLLVKDTVGLIYGENNLSVTTPMNCDTESIFFIKPSTTHINGEDSSESIEDLLVNRMDIQISRFDRETILDGYGVTCSAIIDPISFKSQLLFDDEYIYSNY